MSPEADVKSIGGGQSKPASLAPSSSGGVSDEKRRWGDETASTRHSLAGIGGGDASSVDVVNYQEGVDVAVDLVSGANWNADEAVDPEAAARVRRKLDWHLLPLLFALYTGELILSVA